MAGDKFSLGHVEIMETPGDLPACQRAVTSRGDAEAVGAFFIEIKAPNSILGCDCSSGCSF